MIAADVFPVLISYGQIVPSVFILFYLCNQITVLHGLRYVSKSVNVCTR